MNSPQAHPQSHEFREVPQEDEYDPFGDRVYYVGDKRNEDCHLAQAISFMPADRMATYKSKCKTAEKLQRLAPDSVFADVAAVKAHRYLMKWVKEYWAGWKERLDGASN